VTESSSRSIAAAESQAALTAGAILASRTSVSLADAAVDDGFSRAVIAEESAVRPTAVVVAIGDCVFCSVGTHEATIATDSTIAQAPFM
jgi:hypothetical protein